MAFLNSQIIEDVYIKYPYSFSKFKKVYHLFKSLYGVTDLEILIVLVTRLLKRDCKLCSVWN
jgi:hypothetical protein